jgi:short-subunit dehydrogenase
MISSSNKKVIIIGATSGIGRELALLYAQQGAQVGITGRRNELLQSLRNEFPQQIKTACFDVTGSDNLQQLRQLVEATGGMDVLIYNSGYGDISEQLDWKIDKETVDVNVNGFIEIVHFAFNYFVQKGGGQIAVTSSVAAIRGNSFSPAYGASKAFASNYCEGLNIKAWRLKKDIVVTDIRPGFVDTKMAKGNGRFWVAPPQKAAKQIWQAIESKKKKVYITRRWALIGWLLKWIPYFIYKRIA